MGRLQWKWRSCWAVVGDRATSVAAVAPPDGLREACLTDKGFLPRGAAAKSGVELDPGRWRPVFWNFNRSSGIRGRGVERRRGARLVMAVAARAREGRVGVG
jgi:hypothetical protein